MTDEVRHHIEKAERSVAPARELLAAGHRDFAISRAYYAMFYAAEALLVSRGLRFRKHSGVHGAFAEFLSAARTHLEAES